LGDSEFKIMTNELEKRLNFMKRAFLLVSLFLLMSCGLAGQSVNTNAVKTVQEAPTSNIVNAKQLLTDVETLSAEDMEGRWVGTPGGIKAREYVLKRFRESGIASFGNSYLQPFEFANRNGEKLQGANVFGYIKGSKRAEKYIIVTAHFDHVGVRNGEIYNGADDDASGTAALFALAEYFKKNSPANSIIFAAFDAEESGLQGSRKFVAELPVKKESILVNLNMDMIAHNDINELYAVGTYSYPSLKPLLEQVAKTATIKLLFGHEGPLVAKSDDWTNQSDHYSFHQAKIPFVYFGVEDHKDYHKPTDDFANINQEFYIRAVETILSAVKAFDKNLPSIEKQN
jgi:Zn-dependent M28 family amino/carboxypeptidase